MPRLRPSRARIGPTSTAVRPRARAGWRCPPRADPWRCPLDDHSSPPIRPPCRRKPTFGPMTHAVESVRRISGRLGRGGGARRRSLLVRRDHGAQDRPVRLSSDALRTGRCGDLADGAISRGRRCSTDLRLCSPAGGSAAALSNPLRDFDAYHPAVMFSHQRSEGSVSRRSPERPPPPRPHVPSGRHGTTRHGAHGLLPRFAPCPFPGLARDGFPRRWALPTGLGQRTRQGSSQRCSDLSQ